MRRLGAVEVVGLDVVEDGGREEVCGVGIAGEKAADLGGACRVVDAGKCMNVLELGGG